MELISAFGLGVGFALGLGFAGMTQPAKIIGFLDIAGAWDPTLAFVMGGAVLVAGVLFPRILSRQSSLLGDRFALPDKKQIDVPLLVGAALFGVGWGLSGYCPGPALVCLVTVAPPVLVFVAFMIAGLYSAQFIHRSKWRSPGGSESTHDTCEPHSLEVACYATSDPETAYCVNCAFAAAAKTRPGHERQSAVM